MTFDSMLLQDVSSAASGDRCAYAKLIAQCQSVVCSIALAILHDVTASEDVAQEVFLAVWLGLPRLKNKASFVPWLRQLTRNQCNEYLRRRRRRLVPLAETVEPRDAALSPVEAALEREREMVLRSALCEMPKEAREVITLFYREDGSVERCAEILGLTEVAARQRLSRARQHLRESVELRFAEAVQRSAPGAALGVAIFAQLGLSPAAQAAGLAVSSAQSIGVSKVGGLMLKGFGLGIGGALLIGYLTVRSLLRRALDDKERRDLKWFGVVQSVTILASGLAMSTPWRGVSQSIQFEIAWGTEIILLAAFALLWVPHIVSRRLSVERARDSEGFRRRRKREHLYGALGLTLGLLFAALGTYFGIKLGGR